MGWDRERLLRAGIASVDDAGCFIYLNHKGWAETVDVTCLHGCMPILRSRFPFFFCTCSIDRD